MTHLLPVIRNDYHAKSLSGVDWQSGTGPNRYVIKGWHMAQDRHPAPEPDGTRHMEPDHGVVRGTSARADSERGSVLEPIPVRGKDVPPPAPGTRNLVPDGRITYTGERVREWVRAALVRMAAAGERFHYDASLVMLPGTRETRGVPVSAYAIVIYTPSALVGRDAIGAVRAVGDFPSDKDVTEAVRAAVADIRDQQSTALRAPIDLSGFKPQG